MSAANPKKERAIKIAGLVGKLLVWGFVAFSVLVTVLVFSSLNSADGVPSINGKCLIHILTDSMNPTLEAGDLIVGEKLTDEEKTALEVGDIISYHVDLNGDGVDEINTHRIAEIEKNSLGQAVTYTTRGDNRDICPANDRDPVNPMDVICRYTGTSIPGVGTVISFLQTPTGFLAVIVLPLVAFFLFELLRFILILKDVRSSGKKQITAAEEELIKQKAIEEYLLRQAELEAAKTPEPIPAEASDPAAAESESASTDTSDNP